MLVTDLPSKIMGQTLSIHYGSEVEDNFKTFGEALVSYILLIISVIVTFLTLLFGLYHVFISHNIANIGKWQMYSLVASLILNVLYCLRVLIVEHINIMTDDYVECTAIPYVPGSVSILCNTVS